MHVLPVNSHERPAASVRVASQEQFPSNKVLRLVTFVQPESLKTRTGIAGSARLAGHLLVATRCPAGFHASKQGSTVCDVCPTGKFAEEASVECNACPPGEFSQTASSKCESCQPGAISIEQGASACDVCPAGKFEDKNRYCRECPPGWTSTSGNKSCTKCPAGFHASKQGSTVCDVCPAGKFAEEASVECDACPPGEFSRTASSKCESCQPGAISIEQGASACDVCPAGKFEDKNRYCRECPPGWTSTSGNKSCTKCPAGFHASKQGSTVCDVCPAGKFAGEASVECDACPPGEFSRTASSKCGSCQPGAISIEQGASACDVCPAGKFEVNHKICQDCEAGWTSTSGNKSCTKCPAGFHASKQGSTVCDVCPAGRFAGEASVECHQCEPGAVPSSQGCDACPSGRSASPGALYCEPCDAGSYASSGSAMCRICPSGHVSSPISASCHACEGLLVRNVPDEMQQSCILDNMEVLFAVLSWIAGTIFCHLLLTGLFGQLPLADVSKQGQKVLITSSIPHFVLTWQSPEVFFTGALHLDQPPTTQWKVESHSFDQLTLRGDIQMPLDTSMGHLHFKFPRAFIATGHMAALKSLQRVLGFGPSFGMVQLELSIHSCFFCKKNTYYIFLRQRNLLEANRGLWHVPLIVWCLASASGAAVARQLHWKLALLVAGLSMCAGLLSFFLRRRCPKNLFGNI